MEIKFLKNLQIKVGLKLMKNKARQLQRKVKAVNLNKAESVGIIFEVNSDNDLKHVKELVNSLSLSVTKIGVIGYLKGKKKDYSYIGDKNYSFVSDEDFNFLMQTGSESISHFLSWKPDILLVLSQNYYFPVHFIACLSQAGLKAGQSGNYDDCLDLMLEMHGKPLPDLTKEIVHYLSELQTT